MTNTHVHAHTARKYTYTHTHIRTRTNIGAWVHMHAYTLIVNTARTWPSISCLYDHLTIRKKQSPSTAELLLYYRIYICVCVCVCVCVILTLDRAVNQRCTCVNKPKKMRKQVSVIKEYWQVPVAVELFGCREACVRASLLTEGSATPGWATPAKIRRSAKWILEDNTACYGQEKTLGQ